MKDEILNITLDDLDIAHRVAKRRIKASGLHLDRELKPYLACIHAQLAETFTEGRQYQHEKDKVQLMEDRASVSATD